MRGWPLSRACCIQRECKILPIRKLYRERFFSDGYDVVEYVGIAIDELDRLKSLDHSDSVRISKESLLAKYGYTETMALLKCAEYGLLSPIYFNGGLRNGCWFCPNQNTSCFYRLREGHPELWKELRKLNDDTRVVSDRFRYNETLDDVDEKIDKYIEQYGKYIR